MALGQELKDFVAGYKTGKDIQDSRDNRKDRKEAREEAKAEREDEKQYRRDRDAIGDSRYSTALEDQRRREDKSDTRYEDEKTHQRSREGVTDERYFQNETNQTEQQRRANDIQDRRMRLMENKEAYPEGTLSVDPSSVPQGSGAIDDGSPAPVNGDKTSALETPDWLQYANTGATRNQPLAPQLVSALDKVAPALGVKVKVFSGGQDAEGSRRTGSHRHDHGGAGDIFLEKDGRQLSWDNPNDRPIFEQFVSLSKKAGLTGFGAGDGYMQPGSMHVGFGAPGVWGAGGSGANAPDWLRKAYGGDLGPTRGPGLAALVNRKPQEVSSFADGGMVESFALGGAIPDGEDQYEPTPIPIASLMGGGEQEAQPEQVAEAIPTSRVPTPTPRPEYDGAGVTSQGNEPTPPDEKKTDDPYELGRRSVRDGLKRALKEAGTNDNGAINDPQSDAANKKYLTGYGAAPRTLVQQAIQAVDPDKKMRPGERNLAAMGQVYKHYMDAGQPEKAVAAASSMVQYYRQESNRYLALSQAAAQGGNLDTAAKAAVAAYTNIPNGRDLKIDKVDGGFKIKVTDESGKVINTKVVNPQEFAAAAIGFNPSTFDEEILNAAGEKTEKFDDLNPENRQKVDDNLSGLAGAIEDPKISGNPNMLASVKNIASSIAGLTQNDMGAEPALKLATAIAASDPASLDMRSIRGHPERVRINVDGQSVVVSRNAIADLKKTGSVAVADKAKADETAAARAKKFSDAGALLNKGFDQFRQQSADNAARETGASAASAIGAMANDGKAPEQAVPTPEARPSWGDPYAGTGIGGGGSEGIAIPDGGPSGDAKGLVAKGNIDLNKRPVVQNQDGSVSTVRSITITDDNGRAILIPTVSPSGTVLTDDGAINLYEKTGQHLGVFDNEKDANAYAEALHQSQEARYAPNR